MLKKLLLPAVLALIAVASITSAHADSFCRLKGGSMVALDAESCAREGGAPVVVTVTPVSAPSTPIIAPVPAPVATAASLHLSEEPKLADAQRAVITLLSTPVVDQDTPSKKPESIERTAQFDECHLTVNETMHLDHGKIDSSRMNLKVDSMVDLKAIRPDAYGVLGKVDSIGGKLQAYAVYFAEYKHSSGNSITVSVSEQHDKAYRKYKFFSPVAYWDAPHEDFLMADELGYPTLNNFVDVVTDKVRLLYIVNTEDEAVALKKTLDDVHALCKP